MSAPDNNLQAALSVSKNLRSSKLTPSLLFVDELLKSAKKTVVNKKPDKLKLNKNPATDKEETTSDSSHTSESSSEVVNPTCEIDPTVLNY